MLNLSTTKYEQIPAFFGRTDKFKLLGLGLSPWLMELLKEEAELGRVGRDTLHLYDQEHSYVSRCMKIKTQSCHL